jgi:dolichol-phosphate mannosyltransferase
MRLSLLEPGMLKADIAHSDEVADRRVIGDADAVWRRAAMAGAQQSQDRPLELAVILPTLNEAGNIKAVIERLEAVLSGIGWEAVFVDDNSSDGTADLLREIGRTDRRIRVVQRVGRRGLASAVVEGMLATAAPALVVMDADLQHDEAVLPELFDAVTRQGYDMAVGTRYVAGGSTGGWDSSRERASRFATRLAALAMKTNVSDPMSGLFAIRREVLVDALPRLSNVGFKILLDLLASTSGPIKVKEVPYTFRNRLAGESKLDARVLQEYLVLLLEKLFGRFLPVRFLMFAAVGAVGLIVHLAVLGLALRIFGVDFRAAQAVAVLAAMTFNYAVNNSLTYRDMRLKGTAFFRGLATFYAVCLVGAIGNIGVGELVYSLHYQWWLAGVAGAVVGVVWNYAASSVFTWRRK